jgi:hypothetical protein
MDESRLFEDVHTAVEVSKSLTVADQPVSPDVAAIERGHREHVDGTTEDYERIEFHRR